MQHSSFCILQTSPIRLDKGLSDLFPDVTRSYIQSLCEKEKITVNGKNANKKILITRDDVIDIYFPTEKLSLDAQEIPLDIVYEDENFAVINKDAGINVHPVSGEGGDRDTLVNALLHHFKDLGTINGVERPGIVHRLDKDTSGLLVIAKNDKAMQELQRKFADKEITKIYTALVVGIPSEPEGIIKSEIGRDRYHRKRMTTTNPINPKYAETHYKTLETRTYDGQNYTLLEVDLKTGRTHQIRVHLASIGHPIVGDRVYGARKANAYFEKAFGLKRQYLHATRMEFELFGQDHSFQAKPKKDIKLGEV